MDAVLLISFGGPEKIEDVRPFLANVLRGRPVPPARIEEVVRHYEHIGGRSPLNDLVRRQAEALRLELERASTPLPVYVGMRNWHPHLKDALASMREAGVRRALGFILASQQSDASWGRYQRDVAEARAAVPDAPEIHYPSGWHAHPLFIDAVSDRLRQSMHGAGVDLDRTEVVFTAHSIPTAMAESSPYVAQLEEQAARVCERLGIARHLIAYQSRSGSPRESWLEPDINELIRARAAAGTHTLVVMPLGFLCEHVEVLYDLDVEAAATARSCGVRLVRAAAVNDHPSFIRMMATIVREHAA